MDTIAEARGAKQALSGRPLSTPPPHQGRSGVPGGWWARPGRARASGRDRAVAPSLSKSHNFIEEVEGWQVLKGSHRRMAFVLVHEIKALAAIFGIERLGFLTLTFADHVTDLGEAQRRFHSLETNVIKGRYRRAVGVWERQKSGRVHFHLLVVLDADIRSGADFEEFAKGRGHYGSANSALRSEWAFWRLTAPKYGFGRTELLPVKSTAEGIAAYVGKYVSKHIAERTAADLGARVIRFIGYGPGDRRASARMGWANDRAWLWRHKLACFAKQQLVDSTDDLAEAFGPRWCYKLQEVILATPLDHGQTIFPSFECAMLSVEMNRRQEVLRDHFRHEYEKSRQGRGYAVQYELRPFEPGRGAKVTPTMPAWSRVNRPARPEGYKASDILSRPSSRQSFFASRAAQRLGCGENLHSRSNPACIVRAVRPECCSLT